jgi:AraC-like DNA-binding protein/mannose-6-phosphate isomerase-like protein (cupin superfamily)
MAVSARSVKDLSVSANADFVDMRTGGHPAAGSFPYEGDTLVTTWHMHDLHQVEYAFHGTVEVETASAHFLLPPQQAAWIPAGVEHRTTIRTKVRTISVFFESDLVPAPGDRVRILAVQPVLREMMIYSRRWPIGRPSTDDLADKYFGALGELVSESLENEEPLFLPTTSNPVLVRALDWTRENLGTATVGAVALHSGLSERSLRRLLHSDLGMSWRNYVIQARLLRAMALLAEPGPSVLEVATTVGFESLSSFNRAFRQRTGETPSAYRRQRVRRGGASS